MKSRKNIFLSLIVLVLSLVIFNLINNSGKKKLSLPPVSSNNEPHPDNKQNIDIFTLVGYKEGGGRKWEVNGKEAKFITEDIIKLTDITAKAFGQDDTLTLVADNGTVNRGSNDIHLEQNVIATTQDGAKLTTDYMDYSGKDGQIKTEAPVRIERDNVDTTAKGAIAEPSLETVKLKQDVVVKIKPQTVITCDGPLEIEYKKNVAIFYKNVKISDERGQLFADRVDAIYDPKTKKIIQVFAMGNVKIIQGENITYCEEAIYNTTDGRIVLYGQPKLMITPEEEKKKGEGTDAAGKGK